jgi:UDP-sulfoquinovose synthase
MQTRAFIHLENSVECMTLAILHPPSRGDRVKIFNQMTQTLRLADIAKKICEWYPATTVQHLENPRNELAENGLEVCNQQFLEIGLKPIFFDHKNINEIYEHVKQNVHRVGPEDQILPVSFWK